MLYITLQNEDGTALKKQAKTCINELLKTRLDTITALNSKQEVPTEKILFLLHEAADLLHIQMNGQKS